MTVTLAGTEDHPQARMVLSAALASGQPSHAYLFHGPAGTGKRTVARAFAAELLAEGSDDPDAVRTRVMHGAHPDLTWVRPSGAHVMRVDDVEGPVVNAAYPDAVRGAPARVRAGARGHDERRGGEPAAEDAGGAGVVRASDPDDGRSWAGCSRRWSRAASWCASSRCRRRRSRRTWRPRACRPSGRRHARGWRWGTRRGLATWRRRTARQLRSEVEQLVRGGAVRRIRRRSEPWRPLLARAEAQGLAAEEAVAVEAKRRLELEPKGRERKAIEKEFEESAKRDGRRARRESLELVADADRADVPRPDLPRRGRVRGGAGRRPHAGAGRAGPKPRPAPAARGGRALRGGAPVAGAERDRGPGAVGAGLQAGGAGGRALDRRDSLRSHGAEGRRA